MNTNAKRNSNYPNCCKTFLLKPLWLYLTVVLTSMSIQTNAQSSSSTTKSSNIRKIVARSMVVPQQKLAPAFASPFINGKPDYPNVGGPNNFGVIELTAGIGKAEGGLQHHRWSHFSNWNSSNHAVVWELTVPKAGEYEVRYCGAHGDKSIGNKIAVSVAGQTISTEVKSTGDWRSFRQYSIGNVKFSKGGKYTLTVKGSPIKAGTNLMDLRSITLHPTNMPRSYDFIANKWANEVPHLYRGTFAWNIGPRPYDKNMEKKGYAIITTKNLVKNLKEFRNFVRHKKALGFKVHVITEDKFGGGTGPLAVKNIREWLKNNAKKLDLLYVLMLGDSDPRDGTVPVAMVNRGEVCLTCGIDPEEVLPGTPSDIPFGDYDESPGSKFKWDVLVGRIPYFGEQSHDGKLADVDAILRKTINYENEKNINYRYSFGLDGTSWILNADLMETAGINYISRTPTIGSYIKPMDTIYNNTHFLANNVVGYQRTGGHANAHFIEGGLSRDSIRNELTHRPQVVKEYGGCSCATPEFECHLAYVHLRYQAIAVLGATRSISALGGNSQPFFAKFKFDILNWGSSVGYAQWRSICNDAQTRGGYHGGNVMLMLLGDPSVRPFPNGLNTSYQAKIRPVHFRTFQLNNPKDFYGKTFEFDIESNSSSKLYWSAKSVTDWITLSKRAGIISRKGQRVTLKAKVNSRVAKLKDGEHWAEIKIIANGHEQTRKILLTVEKPQLETYHTFDEFKGNQTFSIIETEKNYPVFTLPHGTQLSSDSYQTGIQGKAINPAKLGTEIPLSQDINIYDSATIGLCVKWTGTPASSQILTQGERDKLSFLDYDSETKKLKLHLFMGRFAGAVAWVDNYQLNKTIEAPFSPKANKWYQLAVAFDRHKHSVSVYANGRLLKKVPTDPRLAFELKTQVSPQLDALVDNIYVKSYPLKAKQALVAYQNGSKAILLKPQSGGSVDSADVELQFLTGGAKVKGYHVRVADKASALASTKPVKSSEGKVSLGKLSPLKKYYCRIDKVMSNGKLEAGPIQTFHTNKSLLSNGTLDKKLEGWKVPAGKQAPRAIHGEFHFRGENFAVQQNLTDKVIANKLYSLSVKAPPRGRGQVNAEILVNDKPVAEKILAVENATDKLFYYSKSTDSGKKLGVRFSFHNHPTAFTEASFIVESAKMPNQAPVVSSAVTKKVYKYNVKDNIPVYDLYKGIKDPDGDKYTIVKISGPNWVDVRGFGSLFTPFGPPASAIGEHEMTLKVTDSKNNSTNFTIRIKVNPAK